MTTERFDDVAWQIVEKMRMIGDVWEPTTAGRKAQFLVTHDDGATYKLYERVAVGFGVGYPALRLSARKSEIELKATNGGLAVNGIVTTSFWKWVFEIVEAAVGLQLQANPLRETVARLRRPEEEAKWRSG